MTELDDSLTPHVKTIESSIADLEDVARSLGRYASEVEADPAP